MLQMPAPYMEYKSRCSQALLVQVGLILSQQGWERAHPGSLCRWQVGDPGGAGLSWLSRAS